MSQVSEERHRNPSPDLFAVASDSRQQRVKFEICHPTSSIPENATVESPFD
jgi:hypothetical protein